MTEEITSHGFTFTIEGHEFGGSRNEADFLKVVGALENALNAMSMDDVASLHAAVTWDAEADAFADPDDARLINLANTECHSTLKSLGWLKPDVPWVSVSAVQ